MPYKTAGGINPPTACIKNILLNRQITAPHNDKPFSEALLFGIGGGIGFGYILWQYKTVNRMRLSLHFQNHWSNNVEFISSLCSRIGADCSYQETSGKKKAHNQFLDAMNEGIPTLVWVDKNLLPYYYEPRGKEEHCPHIVTAYAYDRTANNIAIDDLSNEPFYLSAEEFMIARKAIPSAKHCLLQVRDYHPVGDLSIAIKTGIRDYLDTMSSSSQSYALPAIRKWGRLLTADKNQKGWPVAFADKQHLFAILVKVYENIQLHGSDGYALRQLYADFLKEAAQILDNPALETIASQYEAIAQQWATLGEQALPDDCKVFKACKTFLQQKYRALRSLGGASGATLKQSAHQLQQMYQDCQQAFPLDEVGVQNIFKSMQSTLYSIYEQERATLLNLNDLIN